MLVFAQTPHAFWIQRNGVSDSLGCALIAGHVDIGLRRGSARRRFSGMSFRNPTRYMREVFRNGKGRED